MFQFDSKALVDHVPMSVQDRFCSTKNKDFDTKGNCSSSLIIILKKNIHGEKKKRTDKYLLNISKAKNVLRSRQKIFLVFKTKHNKEDCTIIVIC